MGQKKSKKSNEYRHNERSSSSTSQEDENNDQVGLRWKYKVPISSNFNAVFIRLNRSVFILLILATIHVNKRQTPRGINKQC